MTKLLIYDFDGTLTPYSYPKYKFIDICKTNYENVKKQTHKYMETNKVNMYEAYYSILFSLFKKNNIEINKKNICIGAKNIELNKGVIDYFKKYQNMKHYIVTSGLKDYIEKTKINKYINGVYGTTIIYDKKEAKIETLLTDKDKITAIKDIINRNNANVSDIIYFGDGLTDMYAFSYVHNNGGKTVYISDNEDKLSRTLKKDNIIDYIVTYSHHLR